MIKDLSVYSFKSFMGCCSEFDRYFYSHHSSGNAPFLGHLGQVLTFLWGAVVPPGGHESVILLHFTKVLAPPHFVAYSTANIPVLQQVQFYYVTLSR